MRARDRAEDRDQHHQDRAGRQRVAEQGERDIVGQAVGHDAGPHDRRHQQARAKRFGRKTSGQIDHARYPAFGKLLPISFSRLCRASLSSVFIGRLVKIEMRLFIMR